MRYMFLLKANEASEAGATPPADFLTSVYKYGEDMVKAGVAVAAEVLRPSSQGFRVAYDAGKVGVVDGPFVDSKELVSAYWQIDVKSKDEAIAWAKRAPFQSHAIEVRRVYTKDDQD